MFVPPDPDVWEPVTPLTAGVRRILGVDPGLTRCGVGVIDVHPGGKLRLVAVDVVRTDAGADLPDRLLILDRRLSAWLDRTTPHAVAVERVFSQHNVRTVMGTAQAGAVAVLAAARRDLPVVLHTPSEVKAAVTGSGRADKDQVGAMVARLLGLHAVPRPADAADALALAICQAWRGPAIARRSAALHSPARREPTRREPTPTTPRPTAAPAGAAAAASPAGDVALAWGALR